MSTNNVSVATESGSQPSRRRGRPPRFDAEAGVASALELFHEKGYDAVGVAELCASMSANPTSLYAAYGSKRELFDRAMDAYGDTPWGSLVSCCLRSAASPDELVASLLKEAARRYGEGRRGCFALEASVSSKDADVRRAAAGRVEGARDAIVGGLTELGAREADDLADAVIVAMRGLSSAARGGASAAALRRTADRFLVGLRDDPHPR